MKTSTTNAMYRYEVPLTEGPTIIEMSAGPIVAAACVERGVADYAMEFWAEHDGETMQRLFAVHGTGHPITINARHCATAPRTPDGLVFHLFELMGKIT